VTIQSQKNRVKSQIIQDIAEKFKDIPIKHVAFASNTIIELMAAALIAGDRIEIRGFGSFALRYYPPRKAHNPKTGEIVATYGRYRAHFKPGKGLKKRINDTFLEEHEKH
jgi:integration host factor subunit beta